MATYMWHLKVQYRDPASYGRRSPWCFPVLRSQIVNHNADLRLSNMSQRPFAICSSTSAIWKGNLRHVLQQ